MVFLFIALTIGSLFVEQKMVAAINDNIPRGWNHFTKKRLTFQEWHAESHAPNLIISLLLSLILATMFPAAGLIVLVSGVCSTFLSRPFAECLRAGRAGKGWFESNKDDIKASWDRNKEPLVDLAKAIMALIRTITWPYRKYHAGKVRIIEFKTRSTEWVSSHRRAA